MENKDQTQNIQKEKPTSKLSRWWTLILNLIILVIVGWYLIKYCSFGPNWLVILTLVNYFLLLIINFLSQTMKKGLSWVFSLLLFTMAILIYIFCGGWAWWMWTLIIILYIISLLSFFSGNFTDDHRFTNVPLLLYLFLMLLCLSSATC